MKNQFSGLHDIGNFKYAEFFFNIKLLCMCRLELLKQTVKQHVYAISEFRTLQS